MRITELHPDPAYERALLAEEPAAGYRAVVALHSSRLGPAVGAANNQLALPGDADRLQARGILYVPDYVANAGGVIDGARDICGWSAERSRAAVERLYDTTLDLLHAAERDGLTPSAAADRLAEARLAS